MSQARNEGDEFEFNITIHEETLKTSPSLSPKNESMVVEALELGHAGKYEEAIRLLTEVNAAEPGRASILYNIAVFRHELGDVDGYNEIIDNLIKDFPNYHFGQVAQARRLIFQFRLEEAWDILRSLYRAKRLHVAEVKALCGAMVTYYIAGSDEIAARKAHREGVELCGNSFPPFKSFEAELARHVLAIFKEAMEKRKKSTTK